MPPTLLFPCLSRVKRPCPSLQTPELSRLMRHGNSQHQPLSPVHPRFPQAPGGTAVHSSSATTLLLGSGVPLRAWPSPVLVHVDRSLSTRLGVRAEGGADLPTLQGPGCVPRQGPQWEPGSRWALSGPWHRRAHALRGSPGPWVARAPPSQGAGEENETRPPQLQDGRGRPLLQRSPSAQTSPSPQPG